MDVKLQHKFLLIFLIPGVVSFLLLSCGESEGPVNLNKSKPEISDYGNEEPGSDDGKAEDDKGNNIVAARNATVTIESGLGVGAGFLVNNDCLILSNKHVVKFDETKLQHIEDKIDELDSTLINIEAVIDQKDEHFTARCDDCSIDAREQYIEKETEIYNSLKESIVAAEDKVYQLKYNLDFVVKLSDTTTYQGELIKISDDYDLVLLKIDKVDCQFIEKGDDTTLNPGDKIVAIGNPSGYSHSVTSGIFSRIEGEGDHRMIQIDASVNPGNSGGPIIDKDGLVVGVVTTKRMDLEGVGFAIPISIAFEEMREFWY